MIEKWIKSHADALELEIEKRCTAAAVLWQESFSHLEVPTGIATESRLWEAMMRVAESPSEIFKLLLMIQTKLHVILPETAPIGVKSAPIMNIDKEFEVQSEIVITVDI